MFLRSRNESEYKTYAARRTNVPTRNNFPTLMPSHDFMAARRRQRRQFSTFAFSTFGVFVIFAIVAAGFGIARFHQFSSNCEARSGSVEVLYRPLSDDGFIVVCKSTDGNISDML